MVERIRMWRRMWSEQAVRVVEVVVEVVMDRGCCLGGTDPVRTEREDGVGEGAGVERLAGQQRVELQLAGQPVVQQQGGEAEQGLHPDGQETSRSPGHCRTEKLSGARPCL